jgi:hypothetical protein
MITLQTDFYSVCYPHHNIPHYPSERGGKKRKERDRESPPLNMTLSHLNLTPILTNYFTKFHFNVMLPSPLWSFKWQILKRCFHTKIYCISIQTYSSSPPHFITLITNINKKYSLCNVLPFHTYFIPPRYNNFTENLAFKYL